MLTPYLMLLCTPPAQFFGVKQGHILLSFCLMIVALWDSGEMRSTSMLLR